TLFISPTEKLRIADEYNLAGLLDHCLSALKTPKDFKKVKDSPIYRGLSSELKGILFERIIGISFP
ncbi:hypothetical protein PMAYCL1PPCAC_24812, partial [Pristionchus mayeri]